MATITVRVDGVNEVLVALGKLGPRLEGKVLRQAARKAGKVLLADAKSKVPVDTGGLKRGLKLRAQKGKRGRIAMRVMTPTREELARLYPDRAQEMLDSSWYFPAAVEYGYTRRGVTKPPAGFLRASFTENVEKAKTLMRAELYAGLERETRAVAAKVMLST